MTDRFDLVVAGDPRFPGGTSVATAAELKAAAAAGLRCGFLSFRGPVLSAPHPFHPRIRTLLDGGTVEWLDPDRRAECTLLLAEHPLVFSVTPSRPVSLRPDAVVCVLHHPPRDGAGKLHYKLAAVERTLSRLFAAKVLFAPVGPPVRAQLGHLAALDGFTLTRNDLHNIVDLTDWAPRPARQLGPRAILGRHARPDPLKWPDSVEEIQLAYPDEPDLAVRVLGAAPSDILPIIPGNWEITPFGGADVGDFLRGLDFYVYFHSRRWVEAFGIAVAEALAVGLVTIVDRSFEPLFEEGAVYAEPADVARIVRGFVADPARYAEQSRRARAVVARKFSGADYLARFRALTEDVGLPPHVADRSRMPPVDVPSAERSRHAHRRPRRILFVSSNGVGLGHLARQLAIAERLTQSMDAAFFTLSQGCSVVEALGYPVDYVPSHQSLGVDFDGWNASLARELANAIDYFEPAAVLFDGNVPYRGFLDVAASMPDRFWFWIRRAMWRRNQQAEILKRDRIFTAIFEPGEMAADEDVGPTTLRKDRVISVGPVLLVDPGARLARQEAVAELALSPHAKIVAVQLGSGSNFAYGAIREAVFGHLARIDGVTVVELRSPIASLELLQDTEVPGVVRRSVFPSFRVSRAFDLLITGSGYNSFHECLFGGVPTVFVPNEAPEQDDQFLRARYAETMQLAACLRAKDVNRVADVLDRALTEEARCEVAARTHDLAFENGAHAIVRFLEECLYSVRAERRLADVIDRI